MSHRRNWVRPETLATLGKELIDLKNRDKGWGYKDKSFVQHLIWVENINPQFATNLMRIVREFNDSPHLTEILSLPISRVIAAIRAGKKAELFEHGPFATGLFDKEKYEWHMPYIVPARKEQDERRRI